MMGASEATDVAVIGAGNVGIAVAYYLLRHQAVRVVLIDAGAPMALTSAQSGENYRNWWPHPVMRAFTDHAIDLMEEIARVSENRLNMTRRGYALATRRERPQDLIAELYRGYGETAGDRIRFHETGGRSGYRPALSQDWEDAPDGVDVLMDRALIREHFPSYAPDIATVLHIRRAGDISGQQMGAWMLEAIRAAGGRLRRARLTAVEGTAPFVLRLESADGVASTLQADRLVNAAGPFFAEIGAMLGEALPVSCVYQQKIAFADREGAIPRAMPFSIDLDGQTLSWTDEERELLASEPATASLLRPMPGAVHCRPDGGNRGTWLKMGWAYNKTPSDPHTVPPIEPNFPDIVLRGASRLNPSLAVYIGRLPRGTRHYGGYYTMTPENWPLIGPMRTQGTFMAGALSGFGTMGATATGELCAACMEGAALPAYADYFTLQRYEDTALMAEHRETESKGIL